MAPEEIQNLNMPGQNLNQNLDTLGQSLNQNLDTPGENLDRPGQSLNQNLGRPDQSLNMLGQATFPDPSGVWNVLHWRGLDLTISELDFKETEMK